MNQLESLVCKFKAETWNAVSQRHGWGSEKAKQARVQRVTGTVLLGWCVCQGCYGTVVTMHMSAVFSVWGNAVQWFREQTGNRLFSRSAYLPGLNLVPVHPDWEILGWLSFEPGAFKNVLYFCQSHTGRMCCDHACCLLSSLFSPSH